MLYICHTAACMSSRISPRSLRKVAEIPQEIIDPWTRNPDKQVGHHLNLVPFCREMGVLAKPSKNTKPADLLRFGRGTSVWRLGRRMTRACRANLVAWNRLSTFWGTGSERSIRSVADIALMRVSMTQGKVALARMPRSFTLEGYHTMWMERCFIIARLRATRVTLDTNHIKVSDFADMWPDQKGWFAKLAGEGETVASMFHRLRYNDEPEYFSMWTCILFHKEVLRVDLKWLGDHSEQLGAIAQAHLRVHGIAPHPATLVHLLKESM